MRVLIKLLLTLGTLGKTARLQSDCKQPAWVDGNNESCHIKGLRRSGLCLRAERFWSLKGAVKLPQQQEWEQPGVREDPLKLCCRTRKRSQESSWGRTAGVVLWFWGHDLQLDLENKNCSISAGNCLCQTVQSSTVFLPVWLHDPLFECSHSCTETLTHTCGAEPPANMPHPSTDMIPSCSACEGLGPTHSDMNQSWGVGGSDSELNPCGALLPEHPEGVTHGAHKCARMVSVYLWHSASAWPPPSCRERSQEVQLLHLVIISLITVGGLHQWVISWRSCSSNNVLLSAQFSFFVLWLYDGSIPCHTRNNMVVNPMHCTLYYFPYLICLPCQTHSWINTHFFELKYTLISCLFIAHVLFGFFILVV